MSYYNRNNRFRQEGGYFFFVLFNTSAIIATISVPKRNSSLYVTICTPSFPEGKSLALQRSEGLAAYRYGNLFVFIIPQTTRFVKNSLLPEIVKKTFKKHLTKF